jgi:tetratricopeptide (TPR) repeat protein
VLVVALLGACHEQETSAPRVTISGRKIPFFPMPADFGDLDSSAVELIRSAGEELDQDPENPHAWTRLGIVLHAHRRFEMARTCYEQRLLRDTEDARSWYFLALIEEEQGAPERAIERFEQALRLAPDYPPVHWRLGYLFLGRGELERAEAALQAALALAPEDAASVVGLARVRLQQQRFPEAVMLLEEHLLRLPRDGNARYLLGIAYRGAGRMEEAARVLGQGSGADPIRKDPWLEELFSQRRGYRTDFLRAVDLLNQGQIDPALHLLLELRERQPDDTLVHVQLHRAYRMKGELDKAIELLLEARAIDPLHEIIHLHLAGAYRERALGRAGGPDVPVLELALSSAQRACEVSPTYAAAHGLLGDVLTDLGRGEEAAEAYVQAATLDRDSIMWHQKASFALCRAGRFAQALPLLERLDTLEPESSRTLFFLGAALANTGRLEEARSKLERARSLAPGDESVRKALQDLDRAAASRSGSGSPADPGGER